MGFIDWKKSHFLLNSVIITLIVALVLVAAGGFMFVVGKDIAGTKNRTQQLETTSNHLLSQLKAGDTKAIYAKFSDDLKESVSEQQVEEINQQLKEINFAESETLVHTEDSQSTTNSEVYHYEFTD
jgi:hypothetical protein